MFTLTGPTAIATLIACLLAGCADDRPGHQGCSEREEQRVTVLAQLPILDARPASTEATGTYSGCGSDDSGDPVASHAGHRYRSTLAESEIRAFYWAKLMDDGWRNVSTVIPPDVAPALAFQRGVSCLVKDIAGTSVEFTISFDPSPNASASPVQESYAVQATDRGAEESSEAPC